MPASHTFTWMGGTLNDKHYLCLNVCSGTWPRRNKINFGPKSTFGMDAEGEQEFTRQVIKGEFTWEGMEA